jgi:hypothetical protein
MTDSVSIDQAIDDVFSLSSEEDSGAIQSFIDRLHESQRFATAALYRRTLLLLLLWLAGYLIATGVISEVEVSGFHAGAGQLISLLPVFPIAIGFVAYELVCAIKSRIVTQAALNRCYWNQLPAVWSHDLEILLNPHTYLDVEGVFKGAIGSAGLLQRGMAYYVPILVAVIGAAVPIAAIVHVTYLGWVGLHATGRLLLIASALLGTLFWLRAALLLSLQWQGPDRRRIKSSTPPAERRPV